ncbi:MAG: protein kinase [Planctomycetes bacterium]|nr:protein kinase [Planctomycetota bacterium]
MNRIGPYQVQREIGRGGMGLVLLARDERLQRDVAIKSLAPRFAADAERLAHFRRESRIIAQLNHPHIAQVYHLLERDGQVHLVLEYVPGRSLEEMIDEGGALDLETALRICAQIAVAVAAAHARGIVHRDLKPANIRVTDDGVAKVLDFGIASFSRSDGEAASEDDDRERTSTAGTPGYMAPEQARGEPVDARADVFSLGCILYECLTGRPAFGGATIAQRLAATRDAAPDESRLPADLPEPVRALLVRCLAKDVDDRLADVAEARVVLDAALGPGATPTPGSAAAAPVPGNLPAPATSFVGRSGQLRDLAKLVSEARLVSLTGTGGAGKTRLALELARRVQARFPDGAYLVELAAITNPGLVATAIATTLGVQDRPRTTTLEVLAEHLASRTMLIVIDNCERLLDGVSDVLVRLLAAAGSLRIIATSREALKIPGEHAWPVPSLDVPSDDTPGDIAAAESVILFADRARAVRPAFELTASNAGAVARLCRRLDGIPLAIELAAAQVRGLTPEEIDERLDDRLRLLALEARGVAARHRTLRAAMDWSYEAITDSERRMLRALSVFAGGWTIDGTVAVCGPGGSVEDGGDLDDLGVIDLLTRLVDKSLVIADHAGGESRYRLLETVRQYAAEQLDAAGETGEVHARHLDFYVDLVERVEPELTGGTQGVILARLEAEHDNVLAALDRCGEIDGGGERALRMCGAIRWFWRLHGHFKTGYEACRQALAHPAAVAPTAARAIALQAAAGMALALGEYEETTTLAAEVLDIERARGDEDGVARALNSLGNAAYYRGALDEAKRHHEESLLIRRAQQDDAGIATSLNNLANVASDRGRHVESRALYEEALRINRRSGNRAWQAINLNNLGLLAFHDDDLDATRRLHEEALAIRRELADRHGIAESTNHLGKLARHDDDLDRARHLHEESLTLRRDLGDRLGMADSLDDTAMLAARQNALELAARLFGASERLRAEIGSPRPAQERAEAETCLAPVRAAIGPDAFDELVAAGRRLSLDEVTTDALSWLAADRGASATAITQLDSRDS